MVKVISSREAAGLVRSGDVVAVNGFVGFGHPEEMSILLEERFLKTGEPRDLTLVNGAGQGDGKSAGMNHFGHEGMVRRVVCGHIGLAPKVGALISANKAEGYNLPQGVVTHLYRAIAGRKPGVLTHVGLGTFVDPRIEGGRLNPITTESLVSLVHIEGEEYLFYKAFPIDVGLIRGTTSDENGNISMEKEATLLETLSIAQAVRNSGGIVIAQVERLASAGALHPKDVKVPGILVDYVFVAKRENHPMSFVVDYDPAWSGEIRVPTSTLPSMDLDERKVIARRCAMELRPNSVVNLGIGMPDGVASVAVEECVSDLFVLTIESGAIGGIPAKGLGIGASTNAEAFVDHPYQFDFYDGGGIDLAFLGLAQADRKGNVNVSKFNGRVVGCGGFINISQNAKKVVFCGTFSTKGLIVEVKDGAIRIAREGEQAKFVDEVEQITFSGEYARRVSQEALYVTERAVFELGPEGLIVTEVAPGIDIERDVLSLMEFRAAVSPALKTMDPRIFMDGEMGLRRDLGAKEHDRE